MQGFLLAQAIQPEAFAKLVGKTPLYDHSDNMTAYLRVINTAEESNETASNYG